MNKTQSTPILIEDPNYRHSVKNMVIAILLLILSVLLLDDIHYRQKTAAMEIVMTEFTEENAKHKAEEALGISLKELLKSDVPLTFRPDMTPPTEQQSTLH